MIGPRMSHSIQANTKLHEHHQGLGVCPNIEATVRSPLDGCQMQWPKHFHPILVVMGGRCCSIKMQVLIMSLMNIMVLHCVVS